MARAGEKDACLNRDSSKISMMVTKAETRDRAVSAQTKKL
jgi:hypothetical protein